MSAATSPPGPRPTTHITPGSTPTPIRTLATPCRRSSPPSTGQPARRLRLCALACSPPSHAPLNTSGYSGTAPTSAAAGRRSRSAANRLVAEAVAPAFDVADRGRREVHRAAERAGVAVALEERASGG